MTAYDLAQDTQYARDALPFREEGFGFAFSLVRLDRKNNSQSTYLQPRHFREIGSSTIDDHFTDMLGDTAISFSHEPPAEAFQDDKNKTLRLKPLTTSKNIGSFLLMKSSPAKNPFNRNGMVNQNEHHQQSLYFGERQSRPTFNTEGFDTWHSPRTPTIMPETASFMPPPCRPGEYYENIMDREKVLPFAILLPDF